MKLLETILNEYISKNVEQELFNILNKNLGSKEEASEYLERIKEILNDNNLVTYKNGVLNSYY